MRLAVDLMMLSLGQERASLLHEVEQADLSLRVHSREHVP
jgi:hypothetical protein